MDFDHFNVMVKLSCEIAMSSRVSCLVWLNEVTVLGATLLCLRNAVNIHVTATLMWWGYCSAGSCRRAVATISGVMGAAGRGVCLTFIEIALRALATVVANKGAESITAMAK